MATWGSDDGPSQRLYVEGSTVVSGTLFVGMGVCPTSETRRGAAAPIRPPAELSKPSWTAVAIRHRDDEPTAKLHVAGDTLVDGNIGAKYQDVAEWVEAAVHLSGHGRDRRPGRGQSGNHGSGAYDTRVAGPSRVSPG